jgi:hypothetical protein
MSSSSPIVTSGGGVNIVARLEKHLRIGGCVSSRDGAFLLAMALSLKRNSTA